MKLGKDCEFCGAVYGTGHYANCPVLREEEQERRDTVVREMREQYIARTPDMHERKRQVIAEFRHDLERNKAWLPGAVFIANPGLAEYILECLELWRPQDVIVPR